jgi:HAD superfamily hydrolase (TIGR01509 family)
MPDSLTKERYFSDGRRYSAIIFDMDGLMLDTEMIERLVWQQATRELQCSMDDADFALLVGRTEKDVKGILTNLWTQRGESPHLFDDILNLKKQYYKTYIAEKGIPTKRGLTELLKWIKETQLPCAVASSSRRELVLERLTISKLDLATFDVIIGGDEVEHGKPAPDIFLLAAKKLNVPPPECLVLEDSDSGILAAHAAGMIPLMIPDPLIRLADPPAVILERVYRKFDSLTDVLDYLQA